MGQVEVARPSFPMKGATVMMPSAAYGDEIPVLWNKTAPNVHVKEVTNFHSPLSSSPARFERPEQRRGRGHDVAVQIWSVTQRAGGSASFHPYSAKATPPPRCDWLLSDTASQRRAPGLANPCAREGACPMPQKRREKKDSGYISESNGISSEEM